MECDPPLGMSSSVIHLIEFYEQDSHIREPACLLPSTHPPLLAAWGGEGEQGCILYSTKPVIVWLLIFCLPWRMCRELDRHALQDTHCLMV